MTAAEQRAIAAELANAVASYQLDALRDFGCFRLGARIWELRQDGYNITKTWLESDDGRKRWAKYRLQGAR